MSEEQSTSLAIIEIKNPALVFVPQGLDPLLERIKEEVRKEQPNLDISTPAGRKAIASLAYKIAQSKTKLDGIGKKLTEEQRLFIEGVNEERKRAWVELEKLQNEVREPLTVYEAREKIRVEEHEFKIKQMKEWHVHSTGSSSETMEGFLKNLTILYTEHNWEEFAMRAEYEHKIARATLSDMIEKQKKHEADQAELARLRAAEEARVQKEREDKIAADAAAEAKKAAEDKAALELKAQQDKADQETKKAAQAKKDLQDKLDQAERDKKQAAIDAQAKADKAVADEKARVAKVKADEEAATALREKNTAHKKKINNEALEAFHLIFEKFYEEDSRDVIRALITAIAKGEIPHVSIGY